MSNNKHKIIECNDFSHIKDLHNQIDEFDKVDQEFFKKRCLKQAHLKLLAYYNDEPAGYMVAYDRYKDGSLYCWMGGGNKKT